MTVGAVILAGGQSRRMGQNKAALTYVGQRFLEKIAGELSGFDERLLSVAGEMQRTPSGFTPVWDTVPNGGPMAGLYAALSVCKSEALLAVSCDLPLFSGELGDFLVSELSDWDAVIPLTGERTHPVCAVYRKSCAAVLKRHLDGGDRKLRNALFELRTKYVPLTGAFAEILLKNINTPEEYRSLCDGKAKP